MINMKKESGITLVALVITVIVMVILAFSGITVTNIIAEARAQAMITDMLLIQTKVKMIKEQVAFSGDEGVYVGDKLSLPENEDVKTMAEEILEEELSSGNLYIYNRATLDSLKLNGVELLEDNVYIVDYDTADVISTKSRTKSGVKFYKLSEVM